MAAKAGAGKGKKSRKFYRTKNSPAQLEAKILKCQEKIKKFTEGISAEKNTLKELQTQLKEVKKAGK